MKKLTLFWQLLPFYALLVGAVSFAFWTHYSHTLQISHASAAAAEIVKSVSVDSGTHSVVQGKPVRMLIPALSLDLPIVDGTYNSSAKSWTLSKVAANFATNTPLVNNTTGKSLIYGHATKGIFGSLQNSKKGDVVYIYTNNGHVFRYTYASTEVVAPQDTSVFDHLKGGPGIYLVTCDGLWSSERRITLFNLENSK